MKRRVYFLCSVLFIYISVVRAQGNTLAPGVTQGPTIAPGLTQGPTLAPGLTQGPTIAPGLTQGPTLAPRVTNRPTSTPKPTLHPIITSTTTQTPVIKYTCDAHGVSSITAKNISNVRILLNTTTHLYCKPSSMLLKNCLGTGNTKVTKLPNPLIVLYEEEQNQNIIGGQVVFLYNLTCNDSAQNLIAETSFNANKTELYTSKNENTELKNALKLTISTSNSKLKAPTEVGIGEELFLIMTGPAGYSINPGMCTAYPKAPTTIAKMWKSTANKTCNDYDKALIEQNWTGNHTYLYIKIYGFKFVDSEEVTINCSARVCPEAKNCNQFCVKTTTTQTGTYRRRRNAIIDKNDDESASVTFHVTALKTSNTAAGITSSIIVCFVLVLVAVGWM